MTPFKTNSEFPLQSGKGSSLFLSGELLVFEGIDYDVSPQKIWPFLG